MRCGIYSTQQSISSVASAKVGTKIVVGKGTEIVNGSTLHEFFYASTFVSKSGGCCLCCHFLDCSWIGLRRGGRLGEV